MRFIIGKSRFWFSSWEGGCEAGAGPREHWANVKQIP